jgi:DNA-binding LytR/AlgR family response regulator
MIKIAIVDDERSVCGQLESLLLQYGKLHHLEIETEVFFSGEAFLEYLCRNRTVYHLMLLDIELGTCSGVDIGKFIREEMKDYAIQIAYISGKIHYAMALFQISPLDFLVKPLNYEQVSSLMDKLLLVSQLHADTFLYKIGHESFQVKTKDILYFKSADRKIQVVLAERTDEFYGKMDEVIAQVSSSRFLNVHKSYLVNIDFVKIFRYDSLTMCNGAVIPIAQSRRCEIRRFQMELERERLQ